jgi:hypothetical protein
LSTAFFQNVNNVLTGEEFGKDTVVKIEAAARRVVQNEGRTFCVSG